MESRPFLVEAMVWRPEPVWFEKLNLTILDFLETRRVMGLPEKTIVVNPS